MIGLTQRTVQRAMNTYELVSHWHFAAPIDCIWDALYDVQAWPKWWKYVLAVEELQRGDATDVGALRRYTWGSRLPYRLTFSMRTTVVNSPHLLEGVAQGQLEGMGRWTLHQDGVNTHVRYDWQVSTSRAWMKALAPLLSPLFRWNHGEVMAEGAQGLARYLGVRQFEA
jgi:Polyketide cyclase / dehydrase and lipid transport